MQKDLTEMVFILDRSGSMAGKEKDTIGGFNALIEKQKVLDGKALVTTILFDDVVEILHNRVDLKDIKPLTTKEYYVRGCTALLDAVGSTIQKLARIRREEGAELCPAHTVFVITTDGLENASSRYSFREIRHMIEMERDVFGWEFIFLGANMDAIAVAADIGIRPSHASCYHTDARGSRACFDAMDVAVSNVRMYNSVCCEAAPDWKEDLEEDEALRQTGFDEDDDQDE